MSSATADVVSAPHRIPWQSWEKSCRTSIPELPTGLTLEPAKKHKAELGTFR